MARSNQEDRDGADEQPGMTEQEMVARFLEEYRGDDTQDDGSEEEEILDRFVATLDLLNVETQILMVV